MKPGPATESRNEKLDSFIDSPRFLVSTLYLDVFLLKNDDSFRFAGAKGETLLHFSSIKE